jgi:hypothetical protein
MPDVLSPANSHRLTRLAEKMHDQRYRDGYIAAHTRQVLAKQMRSFRGEKSQTEFAAFLDKRQTVVSRLENPSYSGWTLGTLFEIASKVGVAVFVRFVDFPTFLKYSDDQTGEALHPRPYDRESVDAFALYEAEKENSQTVQFSNFLNAGNILTMNDILSTNDVLTSSCGGATGYLPLNASPSTETTVWETTPANQAVAEDSNMVIANERAARQRLEEENKRLKEALLSQSSRDAYYPQGSVVPTSPVGPGRMQVHIHPYGQW